MHGELIISCELERKPKNSTITIGFYEDRTNTVKLVRFRFDDELTYCFGFQPWKLTSLNYLWTTPCYAVDGGAWQYPLGTRFAADYAARVKAAKTRFVQYCVHIITDDLENLQEA